MTRSSSGTATWVIYTALLIGERYVFTVAGEDEDGHTSETVEVGAVAQVVTGPGVCVHIIMLL